MPDEILNFLTHAGIRIMLAAAALFVGWYLIKCLMRLVRGSKKLQKTEITVKTFLISFISVTLKILLVVSVIGILGFPLTSILAVLASAGLAIGLALQGALSNLAGGLMILIFKPFKAGDYISDGKNEGSVEEITVFYTKLLTVDNKIITVPNKQITESPVVNFSAKDTRRVEILFKVCRGCDIEKVKSALIEVASRHPLILKEPPPFAGLFSHGEGYMEFTLRAWTKRADYWQVYFDLNENVKKHFDSFGIVMPNRQLDININE
jgi:small conductance mechanosensitive channel